MQGLVEKALRGGEEKSSESREKLRGAHPGFVASKLQFSRTRHNLEISGILDP